jgi:SAM-dependent methyltransferase
VPAMSRKWKQINKFVEVFAAALKRSALAESPAVRVADFGSGKGYLTFAVHEWLRAQGKQAHVTGVELRQDMVQLCNEAAQRHQLEGLQFDLGDVRSYQPGRLDVMIALHACDVATDHAIHLGMRAGAAIIMCSPCCHKQLRPQMQAPAALRPLLQHGIHMGQEAEMVTDTLRAMLLEAMGYETQVFEFIALEHTSKNKMILAVKRSGAGELVDAAAAETANVQRPELLAQIAEIKRFYGLREQCLETLLRAQGWLPGAGAGADVGATA